MPDTFSDQTDNPFYSLTLDRQLCFALYQTTNKITRLYNIMLEPVGLTFSQYLVMLALWERGPISVGECALALDLKFSTVTPLIKRLEAHGLITRQRETEDERRVTVHLTPAGLDLRERVLAIRQEFVDRIGISETKSAELRSALRVLREHFKLGKKGPAPSTCDKIKIA